MVLGAGAVYTCMKLFSQPPREDFGKRKIVQEVAK